MKQASWFDNRQLIIQNLVRNYDAGTFDIKTLCEMTLEELQEFYLELTEE